VKIFSPYPAFAGQNTTDVLGTVWCA